ncbi:MAG: lysophospholipid acyltransferase family protein [Bacteriovoracaceae bacterium]|nr:lysophospholipid acyltransferase family protein [Bacteriovoracaceae bacterium]
MINKILCWLIYLVTRFLHLTYRYRFLNPEVIEQAKKMSPKGSYIIGCWHQNLYTMVLSRVSEPFVGITSPSSDGELIAFTMQKLGHLAARGSSTRGGRAAMMQTIRLIRNEGQPAAITVDGPKGPPHQVKNGIIEISRITQVPILPYISIGHSFWQSKKSWDNFRLPRPFSKIYIMCGEPFIVPRGCQKEEFEKIKEKLSTPLKEIERQVFENYIN